MKTLKYLLFQKVVVKESPFYIGGDIESVDIKRETREKSMPKARKKTCRDVGARNWKLVYYDLTIVYLVIVPSAVAVGLFTTDSWSQARM